MKFIYSFSMLFFLLSSVAVAADIKCYVELANGQKVILQTSLSDNSQDSIHRAFTKKGFEYQGRVSKVKNIIECADLNREFNLELAKKQELSQPR